MIMQVSKDLGTSWPCFLLTCSFFITGLGNFNQNVVADKDQEADDECDDDDLSKWPNQKTVDLIDKWRAKPILYDYNHKLFYNKQKKEQLVEQIAEDLNVSRE